MPSACRSPPRIGKRLLPPMDDRFSVRRGTYRVIYRIDDKARSTELEHRAVPALPNRPRVLLSRRRLSSSTDALAVLPKVLILGLLASGLTWLVVQARYRRSGGERRAQLKWLYSGAIVFVLSFFIPGQVGNNLIGPFGAAALPVRIGCAGRLTLTWCRMTWSMPSITRSSPLTSRSGSRRPASTKQLHCSLLAGTVPLIAGPRDLWPNSLPVAGSIDRAGCMTRNAGQGWCRALLSQITSPGTGTASGASPVEPAGGRTSWHRGDRYPAL